MMVGVVGTRFGPRAGGNFTFQQEIAEAIAARGHATHHRFRFYSRGVNRDSGGSAWTMRKEMGALLATRLTQLARDAQDQALGTRAVSLSTGLERRLRRDGVDLVWFATQYAEDCGLPYICTVLDLGHLEHPWFPELSSDGRWEQRQKHFSRHLRKATRVIVPNAAGRDQVVRHFALDPARLIILPHPTPKFARIAGKQDAKPLGALSERGVRPPYVLYPAQFWAHKNHPALLSGIEEVNRRVARPFQIVCVGSDKGQRGHVRSLAESLGLGRDLLLLGFVEQDELVALYQHAHALVYLSYLGPENLPPLEAFALGCPVVHGAIPGADEQLGDAALIVPATSAAAVADAVLRLCDAAERDTLVRAGRERAAGRTADAYVDGVIDFLDEFEEVKRCW